MLEELRKHYSEAEINTAVDEWLSECEDYTPTIKGVAIVAACIVVPVVIVGIGAAAISTAVDSVLEKRNAKKREEHN